MFLYDEKIAKNIEIEIKCFLKTVKLIIIDVKKIKKIRKLKKNLYYFLEFYILFA
jgi:hypothetical protein